MSAELNKKIEASLEVIDGKKSLPTIQIQGKEYTLVKDRILYFNEKYPNGCIHTEIINELTEDRFIINAIVIPDVANPTRLFTGKSQAIIGDGYINKTSALENAETSAVGRALAMMGIGVVESVASADEIHKAKSQEQIVEEAKIKAAELRSRAANEQGGFSLDGEILTCVIKGVQKKTTTGPKKTPFVSVVLNGRLPNGANFASCFDKELWEALNQGVNKECDLKVVMKEKFANIVDVLKIEGISEDEEPPTADDDIPF